MKILDYGCGEGLLIPALKKAMKDNPYQYIGVNHGSVEPARQQAIKCGLYNPCFYTTKEFERLNPPLEVDFVFMRNVLHEIPLRELGKRLYHILRSLKVEGVLFLQDLYIFLKDEPKSVIWEEEDYTSFFSVEGLEIEEPRIYQPKGSLTFIEVIITKKSDTIPTEKELFQRGVELFKSKEQRVYNQYINIKAQLGDASQIKNIG